MRWADDIAQWHHDLEDAIRGGALPIVKICDAIKESLGASINEYDSKKLIEMQNLTRLDRKCMADLSHIVINTLVNDLVKKSKENFEIIIGEIQSKNCSIISEQLFCDFENLDLTIKKNKVIDISSNIHTDIFKGLIRESIHHSRNVERMNEKGKYIIRKLFEAYYAHPQQLPDGPILHFLIDAKCELFKTIEDAKTKGIGEARVEFDKLMRNPTIYIQSLLMRRICDHIASMTDRYAIEEYNNLYG